MQSVREQAHTGVPILSSQDLGTKLKEVSPDVCIALFSPYAVEELCVNELGKQNQNLNLLEMFTI